jgi:5-methylcytosine-specific restriction endonuclease McrA
LRQRSTPQRKIVARDRGFCQVPGCSRPAEHAHHIAYRSAGGSDDPSNLVSLCAAHHLFGVHMGRIRVRGTAPDGLHWELGVRRPAA